MALFTLTYDLRKQRNYDELYEELKNFKSIRILESTWCFNRFNTSSSGLRDHFRNFIDPDDGLFVAEVNDWASWASDGTPNKLT